MVKQCLEKRSFLLLFCLFLFLSLIVIGNVNVFPSVTKNINNFDWDVWADQIQMGESPDKPQIVNGLILRMEFDSDITVSENPHLERIVIGTNDIQGNTYWNVQRATACMNGLLVTNTTNRSSGAADPYKWTTGPMMIQRDTLVQCFGVAVQNVEDSYTMQLISP